MVVEIAVKRDQCKTLYFRNTRIHEIGSTKFEESLKKLLLSAPAGEVQSKLENLTTANINVPISLSLPRLCSLKLEVCKRWNNPDRVWVSLVELIGDVVMDICCPYDRGQKGRIDEKARGHWRHSHLTESA
jgi:hypothetical protein